MLKGKVTRRTVTEKPVDEIILLKNFQFKKYLSWQYNFVIGNFEQEPITFCFFGLEQRCIQTVTSLGTPKKSLAEAPTGVVQKKDVLKSCTIFAGKHLFQSLLSNKVAGPQRHTSLFKKSLQHRVFTVNFKKF